MDTKKLRQKILDLAIRGKLVPQDPNDEPASVLLERIRAEKERLIKEGKIKRSKKSNSDTPHYENVPFEIPESWEWIKISDIAISELGKTLDKGKNKGNPYNYLCALNVKWGLFDLRTLKQILIEDDERERYLVRKGDLLVCEGGDVGRAAIWESDDEIYYQNALHRVRFRENISQYFYLYIFQYYKFIGLIDGVCGGVTIKHFTQNSMQKLMFPLPPIDEQKRIVSEINKWFSIIEEIDKNNESLRLSISKIKSQILDLAIHGKLVSQDPNDEPAIELLKRINSNFTPCDTPHYEDIFPYVIPENWKWVTIKDLLVNRDSERIPISLAIRKKQQNKKYDYYGAAGVIDKVEKYLFSERLLLIGEDGANLLSRSKNNAFIADGHYWVNNHAHVLDCSEKYILDYVAYAINAMSLEKYITGSAQPKLTQDNLNKIPIPLPPKEELLRIIGKIEEFYALIDEIKKSLEA